VVGEVRGAEVLDLLIALNTGHEGSAGTVHANSASDVPARLEALGLLASVDRLSIHALITSGLSVVVHVARESGRRVIESINVLRIKSDGSSSFEPAWIRRGGALEPGQAHEQWQRLIEQSRR
jgi:pilus assembly protein CpaF